MKKIKILKRFISIVLLLYVINYVGSLYLEIFTDFTQGYRTVSNQFIFGYYTPYVGMILSVLTFGGLFFVRRALVAIIRKGFFNGESIVSFRMAAYLLLLSGVLSLSFNLLLFNTTKEIVLFTGMSKDVLLMVLGFGILIIVDILERGTDIKTENDLTI